MLGRVIKSCPWFAWQDFLLLRLSVYVSVSKISQNVLPINFIFGGSLPSHPGRKPFDFEENCPEVRLYACVCVCACVCVGGANLGLMTSDRKIFEWL